MSAFYVYELTDPRDGVVFYVGKGVGNRLSQHENEAQRGKSGDKCDRIREIIASGSRPLANIVQTFSVELEAYEAEAKLIAHYGLENLTNVSPGGGGGFATPLDPIKEARDVIRTQRKTIRRVIDLHKAGVTATWNGYDFVKSGYEVAVRLRDLAGQEYFIEHVGAF